ncbi:MAG TPA: YjcZ family sporulation protein [Bacillus sp. (in: firmicutes)]|nr:YjcZ family sporulation protein [Bacillus litorisediminis]HWO78691.1 YjcZ family sporulation protein [Bacillus sp. (in: firmicutes)]
MSGAGNSWGFALIVVLFILLIIVGAGYAGNGFY